MKEYDPTSGYYVYKNKRTGKTQDKKPRALGDEDLPNPKVHMHAHTQIHKHPYALARTPNLTTLSLAKDSHRS